MKQFHKWYDNTEEAGSMMMPEPEIAVRDKSDRNKDDRNKMTETKGVGKLSLIHI